MAAADSKKEDDIFPSIRKSKFSDYVEELDRLAPEEFGSYAFQLMILNQLAMEKGNNPAYKVNDVTEKKNRWVNVLPNEKSRVKLSRINNDPNTDYINASFLEKLMPGVSKTVYIATQAPVPGSIADFWRMVWEQRTPLIVMLTALVEKGRQKADIYWDEEGKDYKSGNITVRLTNPDPSNLNKRLVTRVFEVSCGNEKRIVTQLQYKSWPDHGVPASLDEVVNFFTQYRELKKKVQAESAVVVDSPQPPMLIHCSAGIGRTGSFALIDSILEYLANSSEKNPPINLFNTLKRIRQMRPGAVQTVDQYKFCYKFIDYAINKSLFGIPAPK